MNTENQSRNLRWYVIHTNPRQEDRAESNLRAWNIDIFAPRIKEVRYNQYTGLPSYVIKPLFPRYIFARFDQYESLHNIRFTRGVYNVVHIGDTPTPVDDEIVALMRSRVGKDGNVRLADEFKPGDHVQVKESSLGGFEGIFERQVKESDRVMILLKTVSYQAHLNIDSSMVRKVGSSAYVA
jgi:transcriptional antiterminator RfaH